MKTPLRGARCLSMHLPRASRRHASNWPSMPLTPRLATEECGSTKTRTVVPQKLSSQVQVGRCHGSAKTSDCAICDQLWHILTSKSSSKHLVDFGTNAEALTSKCERHMPLVRDVQHLKTVIDRRIRHQESRKRLQAWSDQPGTLEVGFTEEGGNFHCTEKYWLARAEALDDGHPGFARPLDPQWMNTSLVDNWLSQCESQHGEKCHNPIGASSESTRPAWIIDAKEKRLVPGASVKQYITLSYRWGSSKGVKFHKDTFISLQSPGALADPKVTSQITPLVLNAIELTTRFGQRYIWIDNLCIDTSNTVESTTELQQMASIYANATFTIVVMDRNTPEALSGIKGVSTAREVNDGPVNFGHERLVRAGHASWRFSSKANSAIYHKRAWTYQEFEMSRRRVVIHENILYWMCQCCVWQENRQDDVPSTEGIDPWLPRLMRGLPNLDSYSTLIEVYNQRRRTYDEDALPGISGLLTAISPAFEGGFLYGLPEAYFDAGLCWRARSISKQAQQSPPNLGRRIASGRPMSARLHPSHLPSWSWIGWHGSVEACGNEVSAASPWRHKIYETLPITTWYSFDATNPAISMRKILSTGLHTRESYKNPQGPLLPGWTRHEATSPDAHASVALPEANDTASLLFPRGCSKYVYRHAAMSKDDFPWYWPFPLPDMNPKSRQSVMPEQLPHLTCTTHRAYLRGFQGRFAQGRRKATIVELYNTSKQRVGHLYPHNVKQLNSFPRRKAEWNRGRDVQLVAICRRIVHSKTWHEETKKWRAPFVENEVYAVLWVEWEGGIAYRLASGEVEREAWEGLRAEEVNLILG